MGAIQNNDQYIGQLLVKEGVITERELGLGLEEQAKKKDFLCRTLVNMGFATESRIFSILSLQIGVPFVNLDEVSVDPSVFNKVPSQFALGCSFLPIREEDGTLFIAMADPLNMQASSEIQSYLHVNRLKVFLTGEGALSRALKKYYSV